MPEPDRPVKTIIALRGRSRFTPLRLCSRAPRMMRESFTTPSLGGEGHNPQTRVRGGAARDWPLRAPGAPSFTAPLHPLLRSFSSAAPLRPLLRPLFSYSEGWRSVVERKGRSRRAPRAPSGRRGARRGRRPVLDAPGERSRGPAAAKLSKSAAKTRIGPERRKRIVDIPGFSSRPILPWGALATASYTPPPRTTSKTPHAPHVPRKHIRITFAVLHTHATRRLRTSCVDRV